ncbi:hypothetical protein [Chryseobacterium tongliaoense]
MKNVLICASLLSSVSVFAQQKYSTGIKNIDEVIINTYIKKSNLTYKF